MTLWSAVGYYVGRLLLFSAVAAVGIAVGIKVRKAKDSKEVTEISEK